MREGEVIHLKWSNVDFTKKVIRIHKKDFWLPKSSGRGIRELNIALADELLSFLIRFIHKPEALRRKRAYVFTTLTTT